MKVLVTGGRKYNDRDAVRRELDELHRASPTLTVIEGGATGADRLARDWANDHVGDGVKLIEESAMWSDLSHPHALIRTRHDGTQYDARAGLRRNRKMLHYRPDVVIQFPGGTGTKHMAKIAEEAGIEVRKVA